MARRRNPSGWTGDVRAYVLANTPTEDDYRRRLDPTAPPAPPRVDDGSDLYVHAWELPGLGAPFGLAITDDAVVDAEGHVQGLAD
jgi:hypothetical protein